ncbi:class I SAM-dependent methyltransferase [Pelagicoccus albus]|uniref:Class I SAM-dependent methyltransferase n=1 Tax=Pelagicoccus albus TaxID=415222 RepID=A0A7X1E9R7_9BACT|nr:class I SAM-dependent methyltransferase [Pelagicoccus albus]MBC2607626.1 class I SAM-dependent methyltransferase [Pelagicoccus albus]
MSIARSDKACNDTSLRFYRDVLGLERLHYGIWNEGEELSFESLKRAQERYETYLLDNIPEGCRRILDVGCGTGEMCLSLVKRGYEVEGLSPDRNQKAYFSDKLYVPFHHSRFEDFEAGARRYDCIIMSESCQYMPIRQVFETSSSALVSGGYLMVCDYFVVDKDAGILSESGHDRSRFLELARELGYKVVKTRDMTLETARTLDMGKLIADRILLAAEIFSERFRQRNKFCYRFVRWLFRKRMKKLQDQLPLLDAKRFCEVKRYEFYLFQKA